MISACLSRRTGASSLKGATSVVLTYETAKAAGLPLELLELRRGLLLEAPDLLDSDLVEIEPGLDSGEILRLGHRWSQADVGCPHVSAGLLGGLSRSARRVLSDSDLRDGRGLRRLLLEERGLGRPRARNRDGLIGTRDGAGLAEVGPHRSGGPLDHLGLRLGKHLERLLLRPTDIRSGRARPWEVAAVGPVTAAQGRRHRISVPLGRRLPKGRRGREDEVGPEQGDERHRGEKLPRTHVPISSRGARFYANDPHAG